ncbi:MFS transporter [Siminovitchia fortis]|uniref:MFS transporter n=1 Tax=Siminovitchia fortis TaxID=254758 RepID=A0A443IU12_9BACI|nr:MFS transporter [Siminovitchia fortis]RWR11180.1 MFS transporter [Siminovitchia fortis]WHY80410.1 MFS transporter [Siminovitchia fortis]
MQAVLSSEKSLPLYKRVPFMLLIVSGFIANVSYTMFIFTQSWFVLKQLQMVTGLGLIFIASSVPRIIFMPIGGVIADKFKKTHIIFICMLTEMMLVLSILFALKSGVESVHIFIAAALVFGITDALQVPARTSLLPKLVEKDQLTRANSAYSFIGSSASISGAFFAGLGISHFGFFHTFGIMACATFFAAILTVLIKYSRSSDLENSEERFLQSLKNGFVYVKNSPFLIAIFGLAITMNFFLAGPLTMGIPILADYVFNGEAIVFSMMESSILVGTIVGSALFGIINVKRHKGKISILSVTAAGMFMFFIGVADVLWVVLGLMGTVGLLMAFTNVPIMTMLQANTEEKMLGRVMSFLMIAALGLTPLSYACTSLLLQIGLNIQLILCLATIPVVCAGLLTYCLVPVLRNAD